MVLCVGTLDALDMRFWLEISGMCAVITILVVFAVVLAVGWFKIRKALGKKTSLFPFSCALTTVLVAVFIGLS